MPPANVGAGRGGSRQPEEQRLDPQERAAANDGNAAARANVVDDAGRALRPRRGVDMLQRIDRAHEVMRGARELFRGVLAGADVKAAVNLDAVGADDLAAQPVSESDGERRLAARRRADDGEE